MEDIAKKLSVFISHLKPKIIFDKTCLAVNCSKESIRSHSIQEKQLRHIAKDGKVLSLTKFPGTLQEEGVGEASTFRGFCNFHDSDFFKEIEERNYNKEEKQNFLFAFRALTKELVAKKKIIALHKAALTLNKEEFNKFSNKSLISFSEFKKNRGIIEDFLKGEKEALEKLSSRKKAMLINLNKERYWKIKSKIFTFDQKSAFLANSFFLLEKDWNGEVVNNIELFKDIHPLFLNVITQEGKTFVIFSFFNKDKRIYSSKIDGLLNSNKQKQKLIISRILANYVENIFFNPEETELINVFKEYFKKNIYIREEINEVESLNLFR